MNHLIVSKENSPAIMDVLQQIYLDGNPVKTMLLLADLSDLGIKQGLISEEDRTNLVLIHRLLGEIALVKEQSLQL